jgi:hypothetical protein
MRRSMITAIAVLSAVVGLQACSDDSSDEGSGGTGTGASGGTGGSSTGGTGGSGTGGTGGSGTGGTGGSSATLCEKYGGPTTIDGAIRTKVIPEIAGDCRINTFFTTLTAEALAHVTDCLSIQAQELFQCEGVTYAGSEDSQGVACRSMIEAHEGLGISQADFDALIEDVAAGLAAAGVEDADIAAAAPALIGMQDTIVESESTEPTQPACDGGAP